MMNCCRAVRGGSKAVPAEIEIPPAVLAAMTKPRKGPKHAMAGTDVTACDEDGSAMCKDNSHADKGTCDDKSDPATCIAGTNVAACDEGDKSGPCLPKVEPVDREALSAMAAISVSGRTISDISDISGTNMESNAAADNGDNDPAKRIGKDFEERIGIPPVGPPHAGLSGSNVEKEASNAADTSNDDFAKRIGKDFEERIGIPPVGPPHAALSGSNLDGLQQPSSMEGNTMHAGKEFDEKIGIPPVGPPQAQLQASNMDLDVQESSCDSCDNAPAMISMMSLTKAARARHQSDWEVMDVMKEPNPFGAPLKVPPSMRIDQWLAGSSMVALAETTVSTKALDGATWTTK